MVNNKLEKKWFKNDIPYTYLETVDKEELFDLLWYLRGYFDNYIIKMGKDK